MDESVEGGEVYLGGFYSPIRLAIGRFTTGHTIGAGVYATNKRLFVLGHGKATFPSVLNKIAVGSDRGDFVPTNLTRDQNEAMVGTLTQNRQFEIERGQVSRLEVKRPPGFLRTGWLKITSSDGRTLEIKVSGNKEYEWTVRLLQGFKPEAVTLA